MMLTDASDLRYQHSARVALLACNISRLLEDRTVLLKFLASVSLQPQTLQAQGLVPVTESILRWFMASC